MNSVSTLPRPIADYQTMSDEELFDRITSAKRTLGLQVMVLGHNYQRDEVIEHADFRGDSLLLSKLAAERSDRPYVVFCGVHFMAETADILSRSRQTVILPDMAAGCSMADMAVIEQVDQCWETLDRIRAEESLRKMRVIAVSGMRPDEVGIEIGPTGVDYWFQKPVDPRALVAEMQRELACSS